MDIDLSGRTALVCGSSQGIGAAIAKSLAACNARIILVARNEAKLKEVLGQLSGKAHSYHTADLTNKIQISSLCTHISKQEIDIVVNNTGGPDPGSLIEAEESHFEKGFDGHLLVSHQIMKTVLSGMIDRKFGRFINIISTSVKIPIPGLAVSNTVRGAMASWSKSLSLEVGQYGITVNNILPGLTRTPRLNQIISSTAKAEKLTERVVEEKMLRSIPAGRFGDPSEIGNLAAFLASSYADYINGASIPVDGGKTGTI